MPYCQASEHTAEGPGAHFWLCVKLDTIQRYCDILYDCPLDKRLDRLAALPADFEVTALGLLPNCLKSLKSLKKQEGCISSFNGQ